MNVPELDDLGLSLLRRAIEASRRARVNGNHPFGAILADASGRVLLEAENTVVTARDCTGHAEMNLMRVASRTLPRDVLEGATLYSSAEPCAMCAGAIYWGGVSKLVYALPESRLRAMTGANPENPTLDLPCREVFARGQRSVRVIGPALEDDAAAVHADFWA